MVDHIEYLDGEISLTQIKAAAERLKGHANQTPVLTCSALDKMAGFQLLLKAEIFQKTGSFKFRGAYNAVSALVACGNRNAADKDVSVVTHSSGNHAAAVALAATLHGIEAHIIVPSNTPQVKKNAIEEYGGKLVFCEPTIDAREEACKKVQEITGATFIPPYNHPDVICGQGTIGLEFMEQVEGLDAIVVPISGGGMTSGIAIVAKSMNPNIKIIAAEPCGKDGLCADVAASKALGALVSDLPKPDTICDGLQARLMDITWAIVDDLVDLVEVVTEEQVVEAMQLCYERVKVVVEPSGAAGLAAALSIGRRGKGNGQLNKVGVILCGGNVDLNGQVPGFWHAWLGN